MKKLLKEYSLFSDMQYFELIVESVINGQRTQAKNQFKAMPKDYQKLFVKNIYGNWNSGLDDSDKQMFIDQL